MLKGKIGDEKEEEIAEVLRRGNKVRFVKITLREEGVAEIEECYARKDTFLI